MKNCFASVMAVFLLACLLVVSSAVAEEAVNPEALLDELTGTYDELFTTICAPEYDDIWLERCAQYVGAENAEAVAAMLKGACVGEIYGQEAVDAYTAAPESTVFDCFFINGVNQFVFSGSRICGLDKEGNVVFDHGYRYVETVEGIFTPYIYKTDDADAGEFTYVCLAPDTPEGTFHIEFRYGGDLEALKQAYEGPYAYWLAAGIPADADAEMIYNCIDLFCSENAAE